MNCGLEMDDDRSDGSDGHMSEDSTGVKRKCGSDSDMVEDSTLPSSSHMSNSKFDQLDCENDVGDDSSVKTAASCAGHGGADDDEPPRKKHRELISIESKRNMTDQDKFDMEIIDDIEGDDDDSKGDDSDGEYVDDNEIYAWLEEGINKESIGVDGSDKEPILREKIVLKGTCVNLYIYYYLFSNITFKYLVTTDVCVIRSFM